VLMSLMVTNITATQHSLPAEMLEMHFLLRAAKQKLQLEKKTKNKTQCGSYFSAFHVP